jgi:hypothetical protein
MAKEITTEQTPDTTTDANPDMPDFLADALAEAEVDATTDDANTDANTDALPEATDALPEAETETKEEAKEDPKPADEAEWRRIDRKVTKKFHNLKKEVQELEQQKQEFSRVVKLAQQDPIAFLEAQGITINDWAERQLKPQSEVEQLRLEIEKEKQEKLAIITQQQQEQYWHDLTTSVGSYFDKNKEQYANTAALVQAGHLPQFFDTLANDVQTIYEETGLKPDLDDILDQYEQYYSNVVDVLTKKQQTQMAGRGKSPAPTQISQKQRVHVAKDIDTSQDPDDIQAMVAKQFGFSI